MQNELEKILASLKVGDKEKNEELIRSFLSTPGGKQITEALGNMSSKDIERLISQAPENLIRNVLSDQSKLRSVLSDPASLEKIKRRLG